MTMQELAVAVAIDPEDKCCDANKMLFRDEHLFEICMPLVRLKGIVNDTIVEFTHFSAFEYLTTRLPDGQRDVCFIDQQTGHGQIMKCCLTHLSFPDLIRSYQRITDYSARELYYTCMMGM